MRVLALLWLASGSAALAAGGLHEHRVEKGDTLIGLRDRLLDPSVRWQQLQRLNRVPDPLRLRPGSVLRFPEHWLREQPIVAELLQMTGHVWLDRGGERLSVQAGIHLRDGDRLVSDAQSSALLRFADGTRSLLRPGSRLDVLQLRQQKQGGRSQLQLQQGAIDSESPAPNQAGTRASAQPAAQPLARPRFELRTPIANLGVRGTRWRASFQGQALAVEVLKGEVQSTVHGAKAVAVRGGQGWTAEAGLVPLLPPPALQALQARVFERVPVAIAWPNQAGAQAWRVQWLDSAGEQLLLDAESVSPDFAGAAELPDSDYRLRVRARSAQGLEGLDAEVPVRLAARPEPPLLEQPAAAARSYDQTQRLAWTRPVDATAFRLQIADNADFVHPSVDVTASEGSRTLALPVGTHHWRVATINAQGKQGPWSDAQHFMRLALPPTPPPAQQQRDGAGLTLRWTATPGLRWQVQAADAQSNFEAPWLDRVVERPEVTLNAQPNGEQQLRVRALHADGQPGPWGTVQRLEPLPSRPWWLLLPFLLFAL